MRPETELEKSLIKENMYFSKERSLESKIFSDIKKLIKEIPNDMELGRKVRELIKIEYNDL